MKACSICGYIPKNQKEIANNIEYGCPRASIQNEGYSNIVELCFYDRSTGHIYPPGEKPEEYQEDPDALHDLFCKKYEKKEKPKK